MVRVAVPTPAAAQALAEIRQQTPGVPLVADIHFDYRLALAALEAGVDKIRLNPGNIGGDEKLAPVVEAAGARGVALRVGVNAGSLEADLLDKHGGATAEACAESALRSVARVERLGFRNIVVSIKASDVYRTVAATRLVARETDCPLHLGITEAGLGESGVVRAACGLGAMLGEGLGDTLRVSLTEEPAVEVRVGREVLLALGLMAGPRLVSCPTCGRCRVNLQPLAQRVQEALAGVSAPLVVAVMGCEVNGPGEAREADVGLAAGRERATVFCRGEVLASLPLEQALECLLERVKQLSEGV